MFARGVRIAVVWVAVAGVTALAWPAVASAGQATNCNTPILEGPGPSEWFTNDNDAAILSARLLDPNRLYYGGYGIPRIDSLAYDNPDFEGCTTQSNERNYPTDTVAGLRVRPKLYVSRRHSFARVLTVISNPGESAVNFTFDWTGLVDQDSADIGATSNGNGAMNAGDRWATTCEDGADDGCFQISGKSPNRAAELAHNWEGRGRKKHSADFVNDLSNDSFGTVLFEFDDVRVRPGKAVTFMQMISLARTIEAANKGARKIDRKPRRYGIFKAMSKREIRKLQNWNPKQAKRKRRR